MGLPGLLNASSGCGLYPTENKAAAKAAKARTSLHGLSNGLHTRIEAPRTVRTGARIRATGHCGVPKISPDRFRRVLVQTKAFLNGSSIRSGSSGGDAGPSMTSSRERPSSPCSMFPLLMWKADTNTIVLRQPEILSPSHESVTSHAMMHAERAPRIGLMRSEKLCARWPDSGPSVNARPGL